MLGKIFKNRYNLISLFIILMIVVIAYKLFNLQIVKGEYYENESEKKLVRINRIEASRGLIVDTNGNVLADNRPAFAAEIVKTGVDEQKLNSMLLNLAQIFEKNNNSYKDNLPILFPYQFVFSGQDEIKWKTDNKISLNAGPKEAFEELRAKYKIDKTLNDEDARKILTLRYELSQQGFNSFKSVLLAFDVSKETVAQIEERNREFPGVSIQIYPIRNYPNGVLASHILGYIGNINQNELVKYSKLADKFNNIFSRFKKIYSANDVVGKTGIEAYSEIALKGTDGKKFVETDITGRFSNSLSKLFSDEKPIQGGKVTLTIDLDVQKAAEKGLEETINNIREGKYGKKIADVKGGTAIAVDVNTGEIVALASYPNFDPAVFSKGISIKDWNSINKDPLKPLYNRAVSGTYPPGSIFKMITATAALEENVTNPQEKILDTGTYKFYEGYQPACWLWNQSHQTHGYVNVSDAIKVSCNIYFYEMGRRLGIDKLSQYADMFGLERKTNIELNGEIAGIVASKENRKNLFKGIWYPGDTLQAAIGQSDTVVTPIAIANYISTLANGGNQYQLHIVRSERSNDDSEIYRQNETQLLNKINIKPENLKAIFEGMRSVAGEEGGTAYSTFRDFSKEITIAGKTGSAQTGIPGKSAHAWFAGFAPFENPKLAVVVMIENGGSGGYTAPVAKEIFSEYFKLNKQPVIPGDEVIDTETR